MNKGKTGTKHVRLLVSGATELIDGIKVKGRNPQDVKKKCAHS